MTKKECFIKIMEKTLNDYPDFFGNGEEADKALEYFNELKTAKIGGAKEITENGLKILQFMQENYEKRNNIFKAAEIGEGLFMSGKSVSGSMRKLVSDGYVTKEGKDPVCYSLTDKGRHFTLTI